MLLPKQSARLAQKVAEVHVQTLAVTEVWVDTISMEHNLGYALLNDLKVLGPSVETGRWAEMRKRDRKKSQARNTNCSVLFELHTSCYPEGLSIANVAHPISICV